MATCTNNAPCGAGASRCSPVCKAAVAQRGARAKPPGKPPGAEARATAARMRELEEKLALGDAEDVVAYVPPVEAQEGDPLAGHVLPPELAGCGCGRIAVKRDGPGVVVRTVRHRYGLECLVEPGALPDAAAPEPEPTGAGAEVTPVLIEFIRQRAAVGLAKYGTPLRVNNGRDAVMDALQESIDLNQYLMQRILELEAALAAR